MFARIAVVKQTGQEQVQVDMPGWNPITGEDLQRTPEEVKAEIAEILSVLDDRANDAHMRTLAAYSMLNYIPEQYRARMIEIIDCLTGRADPAYTVQKWQAAAEETADLERARLEYAQTHMNGDSLNDPSH